MVSTELVTQMVDLHVPLTEPKYSTQVEYHKVNKVATIGAPYRASFAVYLSSNRMKSASNARAGDACRAKSTGRGIRKSTGISEEEEGTESCALCRMIKSGNERSNVQ